MVATWQYTIDSQQAPGFGLFPGGVGNTQKDASRFASLYEGVVTKVFDRLPDETWSTPGTARTPR